MNVHCGLRQSLVEVPDYMMTMKLIDIIYFLFHKCTKTCTGACKAIVSEKFKPAYALDNNESSTIAGIHTNCKHSKALNIQIGESSAILKQLKAPLTVISYDQNLGGTTNVM